MIFHRYHGLGNDYLVCHHRVAALLSNQQIRRICDRHYGIGSDGLLIDNDDADIPSLRIINPDGSEAEKSGNGLRIYARYLFDIGRVAHEPFLVNTPGGHVRCEVTDGAHQVIVDMGQAKFSPAALPASVEGDEALALPIVAGGHNLSATLVSMGNPHCVIRVDKLDLDLVKQLGSEIETLAIFPKRTNVQFAQVLDRNNISIGIWERGGVIRWLPAAAVARQPARCANSGWWMTMSRYRCRAENSPSVSAATFRSTCVARCRKLP